MNIKNDISEKPWFSYILDKRGMSSVIAVVLILLLTISAGSLIYTVLIPYLKTATTSSQKCYYADLDIVEGSYTYLNSTNNNLYVQLKRGNKETDLIGIQIKLSGDAVSKIVEVKNSTSTLILSELGETIVSLPNVEETRTYVINITELGIGKFRFVEVAPIVKVGDKDEICDIKSKIILDD